MKLLAIETASEACSVALSTGGEVRERFDLAPRRHAELLLPWISELLTECGVELKELDALVFSRGPGSFTSLRIGIGVVQGLAWGSGVPVVPVSSLQTVAQAAAALGVRKAIVAMDARMNEVFHACFDMGENGLMIAAGKEAVSDPAFLKLADPAAWSGVGNGFERYPALAELSVQLGSVLPDIWPRAAFMIPLAEAWLVDNEALAPHQAQPVYIRDQVAEKSSGMQ